jgi:uncharacterized protein YodC (DUF2158 family)
LLDTSPSTKPASLADEIVHLRWPSITALASMIQHRGTKISQAEIAEQLKRNAWMTASMPEPCEHEVMSEPERALPKVVVGDTVYLKSGGPLMSVLRLDGDMAWCQWFDGPKPVADGFHRSTLKLGRELD